MESLPIAIVIVCMASLIATGLITSMLLYRYMLEPRPKRDVTIQANIWPLTLPASCFDSKGQKIRKWATIFSIALIVVSLLTLAYIGLVLWLF